MSDAFNDPNLSISKVYTKTGDKGKTRLVGGQQVPKNDTRIEAYGTIDELNSFLGSAIQSIISEHERTDEIETFLKLLSRVQHELFNLGSILATLPQDVHPKQPHIRQRDIEQLERDIDTYNEALPALRSFVLPGGSRSNTDLHICRTVCRRAERLVHTLTEREPIQPEPLIYLNRLSDAFFVWSRWIISATGGQEELWQPNITDQS